MYEKYYTLLYNEQPSHGNKKSIDLDPRIRSRRQNALHSSIEKVGVHYLVHVWGIHTNSYKQTGLRTYPTSSPRVDAELLFDALPLSIVVIPVRDRSNCRPVR